MEREGISILTAPPGCCWAGPVGGASVSQPSRATHICRVAQSDPPLTQAVQSPPSTNSARPVAAGELSSGVGRVLASCAAVAGLGRDEPAAPVSAANHAEASSAVLAARMYFDRMCCGSGRRRSTRRSSSVGRLRLLRFGRRIVAPSTENEPQSLARPRAAASGVPQS